MPHQHNARNRGRSNPALRNTNDANGEESKYHGNSTSRPWRWMMVSRPMMNLRKRLNEPISPTSPSSWWWPAITFFMFFCLMSRSWLKGSLLVNGGLRYLTLDPRGHLHPRCVRHLMIDDEYYLTQRLSGVNNNTGMIPHTAKKRLVFVSKRARQSQQELENSKEYGNNRARVFETEDCKAQYPWQLSPASPTCNSLHESDLNDLHAHRLRKIRFLTHGYRRDVWVIRDNDVDGTKRILKTQRFEHACTERNYYRHGLDAIVMERMTKSPLVLDIYGFCGNAGFFEFADGGDMCQTVWPEEHVIANLTSLRKLQIATQAAMALAAVHNIEKEGRAAIAHTDISPEQFVLVGDVFKLNDFNRAKFIRWNVKHNRACSYHMGMNGGKIRSPEEYKLGAQSEKVDVYALGNVFYVLLTGLSPFHGEHEEVATKKVLDGVRPPFSETIMKSPDPIVQTMKKAMFLCHEQDPKRRTGARHLANMLERELLKWDPDALNRWGLQWQ